MAAASSCSGSICPGDRVRFDTPRGETVTGVVVDVEQRPKPIPNARHLVIKYAGHRYVSREREVSPA